MSHHFDPADVLAEDLTGVIDLTGVADGDGFVWDAAAEKLVPGVLTAANETIFAPDYTVTDGASLDLAITFVWGIDAAGDPYYNAAGVTAGNEAVLVLDNDTGAFSLRPVEV